MRSRSGHAAIEFALAAPLLLVMLAGIANVGYGLHEAMQAQNAAEAGALYAAQHGWDEAKIAAAVSGSAAGGRIAATPAPTRFCGCPSAAGVSAESCGTVCPGGGTAGVYVQVDASLAHRQMIPLIGFGVPATLTGRSVIRVQ